MGHILMSRWVAKQIACRKNLFTRLVPVSRRLAEFEDIYSDYHQRHHPLPNHAPNICHNLTFHFTNVCYFFSVFHFRLFHYKNGRYISGVCHYILFHSTETPHYRQRKFPCCSTTAASRFTPAMVNPLNAELNPICYLLALLGAHHFLHVSRIRIKLLIFKRLMSYIYAAPILDVSRSHTTTQHIR